MVDLVYLGQDRLPKFPLFSGSFTISDNSSLPKDHDDRLSLVMMVDVLVKTVVVLTVCTSTILYSRLR